MHVRNVEMSARSCSDENTAASRFSPHRTFNGVDNLNTFTRDVARAIRKPPPYKVSSTPRKKVDMLFAHLNRIFGLGRLR